VELSFQTAELREICENREVAVEHLGIQAALQLAQFLADILAVETVAELEGLYPDLVFERSTAARLLRFGTGHLLVFRSGHLSTPMTSGHPDWTKVSRIRIIALEADNG
jgi:hypothetical protein